MAVELRMERREKLFDSEDPFFIDVCPVTTQPSSLVLSKEKWRELGEPEQLVVILEDARRDDRSDTTEIPVIEGESEWYTEEQLQEMRERVEPITGPRPTPFPRG